MNKLVNAFYYLIFIGISFAGDAAHISEGGGWLDKWLTVDSGLLLWTILTFLVLLFILRWKAWGPLMDALDNRTKQIEEALSKAEIVAAEAKEQAKENEEILVKAREEAQNLISQAKTAGEKLKDKLETEGNKQYQTLVSNAQKDIDTAKHQALNDIKTMVVEIALEASEKIIKRNLNNEDNTKIIEETVNSFQNNN